MRHCRLQKSLESLGCALLRGTWTQMARAAFRVKELRAELIKCTLRQLSIEPPKTSSILRNKTAEGIRNLSLKDVCDEWKQQTPLLHSFLMTTASPSERNQQRRAKKNLFPANEEANSSVAHCDWLPSVAVARSILLKQRSHSMNAVQFMVMMLIKYSGFQVCFNMEMKTHHDIDVECKICLSLSICLIII